MKAKFTWRKVKWLKANTYTLVRWSDVLMEHELPDEYVNGSGSKFWYVPSSDIDNVWHPEYICLGHDYDHNTRRLFEGDVLTEVPYERVVAYLQSAGTRLFAVKKAVQDSSELLEIEV